MKNKSLIRGENIVVKANRSMLILVKELLVLSFLFIYFLYMKLFLGYEIAVGIKVLLPLIIIWVIIFSIELLKDQARIFVITNKRIFSKNDEISLSKIKNVFIEKSIFGRFFHYGNIVINADRSYHYNGISNPENILELIDSERKKRIIKIVLMVIVVSLMITLTCTLFPKFINLMNNEESRNQFKIYIEEKKIQGWFILLGIEILQVVLAVIPGEPIEILAGILFGGLGGMILCLLGSLIGTIIIFFGVRYFKNGLFKPKEIENKKFKFLEDEEKLDFIVFILFFIPGTPKDALTYFVPLTKMKPLRFFILSTIARIPSIITSTLFGSLLMEKKYSMAILVFVITGVVSIAGIIINNQIIKRKNKMKEEIDIRK